MAARDFRPSAEVPSFVRETKWCALAPTFRHEREGSKSRAGPNTCAGQVVDVENRKLEIEGATRSVIFGGPF